jgi:succinyl-diaminopimelate desuccinylase
MDNACFKKGRILSQFDHFDDLLSLWIDDQRSAIVASVQELVRIPSVLGVAAESAPFGVETRRALDYFVNLAAALGMETKHVDGYAAHAEIGSGEKLIGVLSHVDVVPEGNDWTHPPFGGDIEDGKIYGRGATDDKGPTIAGLYAIAALRAVGVPLGKRIRHIVGADEESGFRCMAYYFDHEEMPEFGFTPDGSFPAIYAEKGIASPVLSTEIPIDAAAIRLLSFNSGSRSNMVPDRAEAVLAFDPLAIVPIQQKLELFDGVETEVEIDRLLVTARGVGAHASTPEEGRNAAVILANALLSLNEFAGPSRRIVEAIQFWGADTTGGSLGIAGTDGVASPLTSNLGVVATMGAAVSLTFSVRYPVTWIGADLMSHISDTAGTFGFELKSFADSKPLFVPNDDPYLATCLSVYRDETGDLSEPQTMGGGTYARVLDKGVAFGADFPGFPHLAHQADEFWYIEDLMKATKIYAKALARLAE